MKYILGTFASILIDVCIAQLGYGGGGYCGTCAMKNSGVFSPGFGYGGAGYGEVLIQLRNLLLNCSNFC